MTRTFLRTSIAVFAVLSATALAQPAAASCPAYPKVEMWAGLSHDTVITFVNKAHDGDWRAYTGKWEARLAQARNLAERKSILVFMNSGVRLSGRELIDYTKHLERRVAVNNCLARAARGLPSDNTARADRRDRIDSGS